MPRPDAQRVVVCPADQLAPGERRAVQDARGRTILVYNVRGRYFGLGNICPHQGGPMLDEVTGTTRCTVSADNRYEPEWIREGEIVRCGWHEWEFEIASGRSLIDPKMRVATYPVRVEPAGDAGQPMLVVEV